MDRFAQIFREEAEELLALLESSLLESVEGVQDPARVDAIFRALHTIKGSSAMFGFDAISSFTHELETVFDLVRGGTLPLTSSLANLTLESCDLIRTLMEETDGAAAAGRSRQLLERLTAMTGAATPLPPSTHEETAAAAEAERYHLRFAPGRNLFQVGANPMVLLDELRQAGSCRISADTTGVPSLEELDPTCCHLAWEVETAGISRNTIADIFIFHDDGEELQIRELAPGGDNGSQEPVLPVETGGETRRGGIDSIRVPAARLDELVNLVGELVTVQARLTQTATARDDAELMALAEEVERLTTGLRDTTLNVRMVPIGSTFGRFKRVVHDLARELGKEVELLTSGAETELDKTVIEKLGDPLVHLIRNSIDHGIETPQRRQETGKPRRGTIRLSAVHSGDSVLVTISDDGAGIDREAVRARGEARGLVPAGAELSEREVFNLLFSPGFSTAETVTSISGRGVGMDVVKRGVDALRGAISIASNEGGGTTVTIRIPLTLAIIESLLVQIGPDRFVIPLSLVEECIELTRADVTRAHGRNLTQVRGGIIPYIPLRERFGIAGERPGIEQVVIAHLEGERVGLVVDHVIGEHQTVIKAMGRMFRDVEGVSGATILGDGSVALILDVPRLVADEGREELCCKAAAG